MPNLNQTVTDMSRLVAGLALTMLIAMLAHLQPVLATGKSAAAGLQALGGLAPDSQTGALYKAEGQALYRSNDGGEQWTRLPLALTDKDARIAAVAVSAGRPGAIYLAGPGFGVLKSSDGGESWVAVDQGLPHLNVIALATHSTLPETVYAVVSGEGIFRSEDGGKSWRNVDKGPKAQVRRIIHADMEGSMQTGWIFAATDQGVYRAMDCFCGFRPAGKLEGPVSAIAFDPKQPMKLSAAAGQEVFLTTNGGEDWQPVASPGDEVIALAYSQSGILYALLGDGRVVESADEGRRWD